jgi:hypothetical protein
MKLADAYALANIAVAAGQLLIIAAAVVFVTWRNR